MSPTTLLRMPPMAGVVSKGIPPRLALSLASKLSRSVSSSFIRCSSSSDKCEPEPSSFASPQNPNSNSSHLAKILLSESSLNPFDEVFTSRKACSNASDSRLVGSRVDPSLASVPGRLSRYSKPIKILGRYAKGKQITVDKKAYRKPMGDIRSPVRPSIDSPSSPAVERLSEPRLVDSSPLSKGAANGSVELPEWMQQYSFSYSEVPKSPILGFREKPFSPFGPQDMVSRPWTGSPPLKSKKKKVPEFDSFNPPGPKKGVKYVQKPGPFPPGQGPVVQAKSREEILGEPLTPQEVKEIVEDAMKSTRMLNLGRDGLTHNMLELIHTHWKRRRCLKIRCKGVPTVDMDNLVQAIEDKSGGVVISRMGGTVYLYRGRNYNYRTRPKIPLMLWKPHSPIYPRLIVAVPEGLTIVGAKLLRGKARKITPLCKLSKNGVYLNLVDDVRAQFRVDDVVRIDCTGLNSSDYRKIGAKLKELVPCVLLSFENEQIMMWRGTDDSPCDAGDTANPVVTQVKPDPSRGSDLATTIEEVKCESSREVGEVEVLYQQALEEGKALDLQDEVLDADLVFSKAAVFAEEAKFSGIAYPGSDTEQRTKAESRKSVAPTSGGPPVEQSAK